MNPSEQDLLLSIVRTWNISEHPEYRGFRCANCQQYKNKAWYHWVTTGGFLLPLHLCDDTCEVLFENNALQINKANQHEVDQENFGKAYSYSPQAITAFQTILEKWDNNEPKVLKAFTCDLCHKDLDIDGDGMRKGWHVWWNNEGTLTEFHFHRECGKTLDIKEE